MAATNATPPATQHVQVTSYGKWKKQIKMKKKSANAKRRAMLIVFFGNVNALEGLLKRRKGDDFAPNSRD